MSEDRSANIAIKMVDDFYWAANRLCISYFNLTIQYLFEYQTPNEIIEEHKRIMIHRLYLKHDGLSFGNEDYDHHGQGD